MADEHSRMEASQALADQLGPAAAAALMECIPPFGWHEIATKSDIARLERRSATASRLRTRCVEHRRFDVVFEGRFDSLDGRFDAFDGGSTRGSNRSIPDVITLHLDARLSQAESRILRWTVGSIFAGITAVGAAAAAIVTLVR